MNKDALSNAINALADLITTLRGPEGCPWDAEQTEDTVRMYLLEEAYEALEAVERGIPEAVCGELGDLLFQIIFLARLAEEKGAFDLVKVICDITEKMIRRHPHVFGRVTVNSAEEVAENWAKIKKVEKGASSGISSQLRDVPTGLPALLQAHRLSERASKAGWQEPKGRVLWEMLKLGLEDLEQAVTEGRQDHAAEEMGRLLFHLVNMARQQGQNAEDLLRKINLKFLNEFLEKDACTRP
ncbi:MAG: nucleoside triphosphate pyrophosphohydrolase [Desulfatiglandales bacterium]